MTSLPDDQVLQLRAIKSERCAASDRNTCARSSESAPPSPSASRRLCANNPPGPLGGGRSFVNGTIETGFVGQLKTLSIRAAIEIRTNRSKSGHVQPDYRAYSEGVDYA